MVPGCSIVSALWDLCALLHCQVFSRVGFLTYTQTGRSVHKLQCTAGVYLQYMCAIGRVGAVLKLAASTFNLAVLEDWPEFLFG